MLNLKENEYHEALVLGKFYPFTLGHKHLIQSALNASKHVTVLCCSLSTENILGRHRYSWMLEEFWSEIKSEKLKLVHISKKLPQYPHEDINFWSIWKELILSHCKPNVVFTSELYGDKLADILKCLHICVDINRSTYNISGTKTRQQPITNLNFLPIATKFYYIPKIAIMGCESTGKTTLSERLVKDLDATLIEEYGRTLYQERLNAKKPFQYHDISLIAGGHLGLEDLRHRENDKKLIISDTSLVATEIFSYLYFGKCPHWLVEYNIHRKYDLTILLKPDVDFIQDGTRSFSDRKLHHSLLLEYYKNSNQVYLEIGGNYEERYNLAKKNILELLTIKN